jgi:PAS domain S-box-containing protein
MVLASIFGASHLPIMVLDGQFTHTTVFMNLAGGGLMLLAAARLYLEYRRSKSINSLLFVLHCGLFGAAATMFEISRLWDLAWWGWHVLRFFAYAVALWFAVRIESQYWRQVSISNESLEDREQVLTQELEATLQSAVDPIISIDNQGLILRCNQAAADTFGYDQRKMVGQSIDLLVQQDYGIHHKGQISEYFSRGTSDLVGKKREVHGLRGNGEVFPIELSVSEFEIQGQRQFTGIVRDVTAKRAVLRELEEAKEKAEHSSKSKSQFLAMMSHEIRTPMNGVVGMLSALTKTDLNDQQRHRLDMARRSAGSLMVIINDILDFSKIESGKFSLEKTHFDLRQLLNDASNSARLLAEEKNVQLLFEFDGPEHALTLSDPVRIRQIVTNLLSNAIKFTSDGTVTLSARLTVKKDEHGECEFSVRDSGIGITEEALKTLFDDFTQADDSTTREFGGTGLGLAIVRRLAQLLGGDVMAESKPGVGSVFRVHFPIQMQDESRVLEANQDLLEHWQAPKNTRVLIVDDVEINREILTDLLEERGIQVDTAENGVVAIERLSQLELSESYQAILMDCHMPEMDGYEASKRIRSGVAGEQYNSVPIIACTANAYEDDKQKTFDAGMNGFVTKPIDEADLVATLNQWLNT